jgi:8-oxo-dGTP pyrophosphatase MutT (NUDIX family)
MDNPAPGPVTPSPSATLILVRQHGADVQVYLLRRSTASPFMPGTYVFPGGKMDDDDKDTAFWKNHVDLASEGLARALGGPVELMLPYAVAAIRETWEEAGLLVATPAEKRSAAEPVESGRPPFSMKIQAEGLRLAASGLGRWHHWITPALMPRRYDTYFFVAPVENNQRCRPDNHETVHGTWVTPGKALAENARGTLPLSPPALVTLHQMLDFSDLDALMARARRRSWPAPIMPRLWPLENGALIVEPWDPDYTRQTVSVDSARLEKELLPVGAPFSRLWHYRGICRPVKYRGKAEGR